MDDHTLDRRAALRVFAGAGLLLLDACSTNKKSSASLSSTSSSRAPAPSTSTESAASSAPSTCTTIPAEIAGPTVADGSTGSNVLIQSGVVRRDVRSSFGSASGTAAGVPLTITFTVLQKSNGCKPYADAAVYMWHCTREGLYSMYSKTIVNENFLRGVQPADSHGRVTFETIFPGAYATRWPHIHIEVFPSLANALAARGKIATSQLALPADASREVYATDGYSPSRAVFAHTSLATDDAFKDGAALQTVTMSGGVTAGYRAALTFAA